MLFQSFDEALQGLKNKSTHDAAAKVLLLHAEDFDRGNVWAFATPMMLAIVALYREIAEHGIFAAGPHLSEAIVNTERYWFEQVPTAINWNPDIMADCSNSANVG